MHLIHLEAFFAAFAANDLAIYCTLKNVFLQPNLGISWSHNFGGWLGPPQPSILPQS
jgi:hypothetical protein